MCAHTDRSRADEESDQVNEVTRFADDPSAAEGFVLSPMVERDIACVDAVMGVERLMTIDD
jgi:hypothetical protein